MRRFPYGPGVQKPPFQKSLAVASLLFAMAACSDGSSGNAADAAGYPQTDGTQSGGDAAGGHTIQLPDGAVDAQPPDAMLIDLAHPDARPTDATPAGDAVITEDAAALPDDRDPLCTNLPAIMGGDVFDANNDCGGRNQNSIRSLRNPSCQGYTEPPAAAPGLEAIFDDVVVTAVFGHDFVVQDADGVAFNAIWVHNTAGFDTAQLGAGTQLHLEGEVIRFFDLDELVINGGGIEVTGQTDPIAPTPLNDPRRVADGGDLTRALESRLVILHNEQVINTAPDCPSDFGNFVLRSTLWVGDKVDFDFSPARGDVLRSITGILTVSFDHRKILPRNDADFDGVPCGGLPDKCAEAECPVAVDAAESGALVITEIQNNPSGQDATREFVEIYNPGGNSIDLTDWHMQDCGGRTAPLSGHLSSHNLLVLASSTDQALNGGVPADLPLVDLFLPNGYGSVLIFDAQNNLVDQVRYEPGDPWPTRSPGESLELKDPDLDNRVGDSWVKGRHSYGDGGKGTPGEFR